MLTGLSLCTLCLGALCARFLHSPASDNHLPMILFAQRSSRSCEPARIRARLSERRRVFMELPLLSARRLLKICAVLLVEEGDIFRRRRGRHRFQEGVDIGNVLIGDDLAGIRRHIAGRRVDVTREGVDGERGRADTRRTGLLRSLSDAAVTFVAAIAGVNAIAILGVAGERGKIARWRGVGRLEKRVNIGEVGVGHGLRCKRRHFAGGLADVSGEVRKGPGRRSERGTDSALGFRAVTGGTHVSGERVFAFLGVACGRVLILYGAGLGVRERARGQCREEQYSR